MESALLPRDLRAHEFLRSQRGAVMEDSDALDAHRTLEPGPVRSTAARGGGDPATLPGALATRRDNDGQHSRVALGNGVPPADIGAT